MALWKCPDCGNETSDLAEACHACGRAQDVQPKQSLVACPDCGKSVSRHASACPSCGRPSPASQTRPKKSGSVWVLTVAFLAIFGILAVWMSSDSSKPKRRKAGGEQLKIQTPEGRRLAEACLARAVEHVEIRDDGTAFVSLRALNTLDDCMRDEGFTASEAALMEEALRGK